MIIKDRELKPWNDGHWSEDLYKAYGSLPHPFMIIDEIEGYIYKTMFSDRFGNRTYYRIVWN